MLSVGLDVHSRMTEVCILDANGRLVKRHRMNRPLGELPRTLLTLTEGQPFAAAYEASCSYGWLYEQLTRIAHRVVVAHPGHLRLIFAAKRKTDRIDAEKLAKLLYLEALPAVHVPSTDVRSWRGLIEHRRRLVEKRTRTKNALRAMLRTQAIPAPRRLWTNKGRKWLSELDWPTSAEALRRDMLIEELSHFDSQIKRVTGALDQIGRTQPAVALLRTIPGVGMRTAEAMAAWIDRPGRFARNRQIGSYLGLTPCEDTSVVRRLGHITKDGPATVRKLLVQSAWQAVRRDPSMKAWYERIVGGNRDRRKIAIVAVAHRLARVMLAMLQSGECYRAA